MPPESAQSDSFCLSKAYRFALAAEIAYEEGAAIEATVTGPWGYDQFAFFDVDETQVFVASKPTALLIAFRGTETDSVADWITDADASLVDGPLGGQVHVGFFDALANVWQTLDRQVDQFDPHRQKTLSVTGHSLGGALAALAAARWLDQGRAVHDVYTFGQPRTGDRTFARNFNFKLKCDAFRFVNDNDLVTRLPPRAFGYSHLGTFRFFNNDGQFQQSISWWRSFLERWTFHLETLLDAAQEGIADHSMIEYRQRIEAMLTSASRQVEQPAFADPIRPRRRAA